MVIFLPGKSENNEEREKITQTFNGVKNTTGKPPVSTM